MASASSISTTRVPSPVPPRGELLELDASTRGPVLTSLFFAGLWLLLATALLLVSSVQLHNGGFLDGSAWLTHGRVRPAANNALVYGWCFNAAFAVVLWLMTRLSNAQLRASAVAVVGSLFWNLGVLIGVAGILKGDQTGLEGLEMPGYAAAVLFAAYAMIGVAAVLTFRVGRSSTIYASQWYLLAAVFWFPWLFSIAQAMVVYGATRGVVQAIGAAWYAHNVYGLWLAPVALAALYYLLPKRLGRPVHDYGLARMGFWTWALCTSWIGATRLIGGPVPAWVQAAGAAAALMSTVAIFVIALNLLGTVMRQTRQLSGSPVLQLSTVSILSFVLAGVGVALASLRSVAETLQFTFAMPALQHLEVYGFVSLAFFAIIYFLLPRVVRREWPSAALIRAHVWSSIAGALLVVVCLFLAGWRQGVAMNNPEAFPEYVEVARATLPFLVGNSLGLLLLAIGHIAFAANLGLMLMKPRVAVQSAPELFRNPPALEVAR